MWTVHHFLCHHQDCACRTFIEDYNTGTLPHKKYYDLAAYEEKKALKAREGGSDEVWVWASVLHPQQKHIHHPWCCIELQGSDPTA